MSLSAVFARPARRPRRWVLRWGLLCCCAFAHAAFGQENAASSNQDTNDLRTIRRGERLSDWMLRQAPRPVPYWPGLNWSVPEQRGSQHALKQYLLAALATSSELQATAEARERLGLWLKSLPVTGRVMVELADARWLQAHPASDPVLGIDHAITLPASPGTVTLITDDGRRCALPHQPGAQAISYLRACDQKRADDADTAWIVQPDGRVFRYGIAGWNEEAQGEPAPGAWLWAPARDSGWPAQFSERLVRFLATQGPALEAADAGASPMRSPLPILVPTTAAAAEVPVRGTMVSASDWGATGLLQTPTARMAETGELRFHYSQAYPYGRATVMFQPLDWLEAGFRYTNIGNRLYGPAIAGDQSYKDKSIDFKLRLAKETVLTPEVALGMVDIGGTGFFSSEYIVANKRYRDFDLSLGLAWGYLGGRRNVPNPLSILGNEFNARGGSTNASGGTLNSKSFFHGRASLFGGLQYQTPWEGVLAKIEYDGNNYQHEPQDNNRQANSPINVGLTYRYSPSIDFAAGIERGNTLMVGFTFHGALNKVAMPKILDPARIPVAASSPLQEPAWSRTAADIRAQTQWQVTQITRQGSEMQVAFENPDGIYWQERIERAITVLHRDAPASITRFVMIFRERGMAMSERVILRYDWLADHINYRAPAERRPSIAAVAPRGRTAGDSLWSTHPDSYHFGIAPSFQQTIGGPDSFILYQAGVAALGEVRLGESTWISGRANYRLLDNYKNFKYTAPSLLPRVRTYMREFMTTAELTLPNLQVTHVGQLSQTQFYNIYAGYLEPMYAGVGGEWLFRPWQSSFAFGIDVNHVRQRDFHQDFALRDYEVNTGHATLYWDTGWKSTHVNLSAGQYLAKDRGITVDISRVFENGVTLGAYATKTNVSAAIFGEGSFDKGIYVSIPFDAMLPFSSPAVGHFRWSPLTRDGGARLDRATPLYSMTKARDRELLKYRSGTSNRSSIQQESHWLPDPERSPLGDIWNSSRTIGQELLSRNFTDVLIRGGVLIGGAALFDRSLDRWAQQQGEGKGRTLAKMANNIPLVLGVGTGLLWMGLGDDIASETAWTSLKAAGIALAGETVIKTIVGRSRPDANLGTHDFSTRSGGSSFPSIHMGVAFAVVTPFAEKYDAPWLYGVAAATAFGRIRERKHFLSDAVAGALIGYGVGSMLAEEQRHRKRPQLSLGEDQTIRASWQF